MKFHNLWMFTDLIIGILATIVYFVLLPFWTASCIVAYIFFIICIVAQYVSAAIRDKNVDKVFRIPISTLNILYFIVQLIVSIYYSVTVPANIRWEIVICCAVLAFYIISLLSVKDSMSAASQDREKIMAKTFYIKNIIAILESCKLNISDKESAKLADKVIDSARYSDPMSPVELTDIESQISSKAANLENLIKENKVEDFKQECLELEKLFKERNLRCKMFKR